MYVLGLGEMMSLLQMRHAKLWLAGQAENWELAAYELDELGEGFDDVVKYHPTHRDSPVAPNAHSSSDFDRYALERPTFRPLWNLPKL